jgi:hypothetical protein
MAQATPQGGSFARREGRKERRLATEVAPDWPAAERPPAGTQEMFKTYLSLDSEHLNISITNDHHSGFHDKKSFYSTKVVVGMLRENAGRGTTMVFLPAGWQPAGTTGRCGGRAAGAVPKQSVSEHREQYNEHAFYCQGGKLNRVCVRVLGRARGRRLTHYASLRDNFVSRA